MPPPDFSPQQPTSRQANQLQRSGSQVFPCIENKYHLNLYISSTQCLVTRLSYECKYRLQLMEPGVYDESFPLKENCLVAGIVLGRAAHGIEVGLL